MKRAEKPMFKNNKSGTGRNFNYLLFSIAVAFYLSFVMIFILFMKAQAGKFILADIDRRLLIVAKSIPLILPGDYHDRAVDPGAISKKEWNAVEIKLTDLASASGVKYAWTDILDGDRVFMTSCNRTEQTERAGLELYYFMPYPQGVSADEFYAFRGTQPVFANFQDKWGSFRAVFVPFTSPGGKKYLACAEYTIDYVEKMLNNSKMILSLIALSLFLAFFPVFIVYRRNTKREARRLAESELNLRTTLNSIGDGVIVTDKTGVITMINPAACGITGFSSEAATGKNLSLIFSVYEDFSPHASIIAAGSGKRGAEGLTWSAKLTAKDGSEKIVVYNRASIENSGGYISGSVIVVRDISEIVSLEEDLRQAQKMESIGRLAGGIAHDFNNMLAAIIGSAEMLRIHFTDNADIKENMDIILKASEKAADMTHKLLAFSRKEEIKKEILDVHMCIENTCGILQRSIDRKVEIRVSLDAKKHYVMGDSTMIENAILNLGINARDAMGDCGILEITTGDVVIDYQTEVPPDFIVTPGDFIEVSISDTGPGIPKRIKDKIFEPYFSTKGKGRGTGLGLPMVYGTVKQHNGMMRLVSEEGKGSIFRLYLPVTESGDEKVNRKTVLHKGKGCILFVDDEELILMAGSNILKSMSYEVITASDGFEAIEIFKQNIDRITIALVDLIMPGISGLDLFHELKKLKPDIQIILSSGFSNEDTMKDLLDAGAAGFILKPYSAGELSSLLEKIEIKNARAL